MLADTGNRSNSSILEDLGGLVPGVPPGLGLLIIAAGLSIVVWSAERFGAWRKRQAERAERTVRPGVRVWAFGDSSLMFGTVVDETSIWLPGARRAIPCWTVDWDNGVRAVVYKDKVAYLPGAGATPDNSAPNGRG